MNKVILLGRLAQDPNVHYTPTTQKAVCSFTLAVPKSYKNAEGVREANFIPIVVWGKTAEVCGNSLIKGALQNITIWRLHILSPGKLYLSI